MENCRALERIVPDPIQRRVLPQVEKRQTKDQLKRFLLVLYRKGASFDMAQMLHCPYFQKLLRCQIGLIGVVGQDAMS
jgi:hypothetical protein